MAYEDAQVIQAKDRSSCSKDALTIVNVWALDFYLIIFFLLFHILSTKINQGSFFVFWTFRVNCAG